MNGLLTIFLAFCATFSVAEGKRGRSKVPSQLFGDGDVSHHAKSIHDLERDEKCETIILSKYIKLVIKSED